MCLWALPLWDPRSTMVAWPLVDRAEAMVYQEWTPTERRGKKVVAPTGAVASQSSKAHAIIARKLGTRLLIAKRRRKTTTTTTIATIIKIIKIIKIITKTTTIVIIKIIIAISETTTIIKITKRRAILVQSDWIAKKRRVTHAQLDSDWILMEMEFTMFSLYQMRVLALMDLKSAGSRHLSIPHHLVCIWGKS